jgi:oligopeptidase B
MPSSPFTNRSFRPPVARKMRHVMMHHGDARADEYYWLRDKNDPETRRYLNDENEYTEAMMRHTRPMQEALYREMVGRIKETDLSVPERIGEYYYYTRTKKGKQYPTYCRKKGSLESPEEILLDVNELADGRQYFRIGIAEISPNHSLLAYSADTDGSESYTIYIKDTATGTLIGATIPNTHYSLEWANDNETIYYTVLDETLRPHKVCRHRIGTNPADDELLYHETDAGFFVWLTKTRSEKYIIMSCESIKTSEVRYIDADSPGSSFTVFRPRTPGIEYSLDHHDDRFYIVTNENARNFKLMSVPVDSADGSGWTEVLPHREDVKLDGIDVFRDHMAIYERTGDSKLCASGTCGRTKCTPSNLPNPPGTSCRRTIRSTIPTCFAFSIPPSSPR